MKIAKVNLPDEIVIEEGGAKFVFDRPSNLDLLDYPGIVADEIQNKAWTRYVMDKLKRIEGVKFEDDDKAAGKKYFRDLDLETLNNLVAEYIKWFGKYFNRGAEAKKRKFRRASLPTPPVPTPHRARTRMPPLHSLL